MARKRLTERLVRTAKPSATPYVIWDTAQASFGIRIYPSGKRAYVFSYRCGKQQRRITLGFPSDDFMLKTARALAQSHAAAVRDGDDPLKKRAAERTAPTMSELWLTYEREMTQTQHLKPRTLQEYRSLWRLIEPHIGWRRVKAVTRTDVVEVREAVKASVAAKAAVARKAPACQVNLPGVIRSNRALALLSTMFTYAEKHDPSFRPQNSNPAYGVHRPRERPRKRYLRDEEIVRIITTLDTLEREGWNRWEVIACIRVVLLTGARKEEIAGARWENLSDDGSALILQDAKELDEVEEKVIPLPQVARDVIAKLPRETGSPFMFPSPAKADCSVTDVGRKWRDVVAKRAEISEDVVLHSFRHTHASLARDLGMSLRDVGALLGHKQEATTRRYTHLFPAPLGRKSEAVAGRIVSLAAVKRARTAGES